LKALFLLVKPAGSESLDEEFFWEQLESGLSSIDAAALSYERLPLPTEQAFCAAIKSSECDLLHMITHTGQRNTVNYGAIAFSSADKRPRYSYLKHFASLFECLSSVKLVVLQSSSRESQSFDIFAEALVAQGIPAVICVPFIRSTSLKPFFAALYRLLSAGHTLQELREDLSLLGKDVGEEIVASITFHTRNMSLRVASPVDAAIVQPSERRFEPTTPIPPPEKNAETHLPFLLPYPGAQLVPRQFRAELERKYLHRDFDVFLSHNSRDKPQVRRLAAQLLQAGILPWFDEWELKPGTFWQDFIYEQLGICKCAIVCIGSAEIDKWQKKEVHSLLDEQVNRNALVIPVFLPETPKDAQAPSFLKTMSWVDFRKPEPPPLPHLLWAITGKRSGIPER
jgi:hypothetical protein